MNKQTKRIPSAPSEWLREIAAAYRDAEEAIPFGPVAGVVITKKELFHIAPAVCLKFRGLDQKKNIKKVTEAALSSYGGHDFVHAPFGHVGEDYNRGIASWGRAITTTQKNMNNSIWQTIKDNADIRLILEVLGVAVMMIGIIVIGNSL